MKRPKYGNKPQVVDGVRFASISEMQRDRQLHTLQQAGVIRDLKRQPRFPLVVCGVKICTYVGDWEYIDTEGRLGALQPQDQRVVEDRKGVLTPAFKIKWALAKALHPEIEWRLS